MRRARLAGAVLCVAVLLASACSDDGDDKDSSRKTTTSTAGVTKPTTPTTGSTGGIASNTLPAVGVGTAAPLAENFFVTITKIEPVTLEAHGVGETKGPGVIVTMELRNATASAIDMNGTVINAHYGSGTPATPNFAPPAAAVRGSLEPGKSATGKYGFRVPGDQDGSIVIDIQHSGAPNVVIVDATK